MKTLIAFLFMTSQAIACGNGECDPPSPEPEPPKVELPLGNGSSSGPTDPYVRQYFAICTCDEFRVAWGFETLEFRRQMAIDQCAMLRVRKQCETPKN